MITVKQTFFQEEQGRAWSLPSAAVRVTRIMEGNPRVSVALRTLSFACVLLFGALASVQGQILNARLSVAATTPARISVDVRLPNATRRLSFRNTYAGVLGLGERIEAAKGIRDDGAVVLLQNSAPGEFQATENFSHFIYEVNLEGPPRPAQMSHVSSLDQERGLLMMSDLLPQATNDSSGLAAATIKLDVPAGWSIASNLRREGPQYLTDNLETAVFLVGPLIHEKRQQLTASSFKLVTSGKWPFSDNEVTKIAGRILAEYSRVTQVALKRDTVLMVVPYAGETGPESWTAETRGNVVVVLLGQKASRKRVLSQLSIVLSHELFHLWVPNALDLKGDYDWFFEGFTLYRALRTDLRLDLISFDDYLETIARVYDAYRSAPDRDRLSLIEASERRWTTSSSLVYEKGMLVAFLYDLSLRKITNCQASLDDVYAELFRRPATGQTNANETIIGILNRQDELKSLTRDYIENRVTVKLEPIISAYGIQLQADPAGSAATKLRLDRASGKEQKKLLACLR